MKITKEIFLNIFLTLAILTPFLASAQNPDLSYLESFITQFNAFLNTVAVVLVALALVFFIWGMAIFILNAGNEEKRSEGKQRMIWGLIALAVIVSVWGIVNLLSSIFVGSGGGLPDAPDFGGSVPT